MALVLAAAHFGNKFEPSYPRNDNHAPSMFWLVNGILAIGTFMTWTWKASSAGRSGGTPRVVILGREQTEEWKGWMQVSHGQGCSYHVVAAIIWLNLKVTFLMSSAITITVGLHLLSLLQGILCV